MSNNHSSSLAGEMARKAFLKIQGNYDAEKEYRNVLEQIEEKADSNKFTLETYIYSSSVVDRLIENGFRVKYRWTSHFPGFYFIIFWMPYDHINGGDVKPSLYDQM